MGRRGCGEIMWKKSAPYRLLIPQILLAVIFLIGLAGGMLQSFGIISGLGLTKPTLMYYKEILINPKTVESIVYSLRIALVSSVSATVAGVIICAVMVMNRRTKGSYMRIVQLPIVVPHVVTALCVINILSQNGIVSRLFYMLGFIDEQQKFPMFIYDTSGIGIILAYLWKEIPFIIYFIIAIMANINDKLGEAAINLGAGKWASFYKVTLPLCKKAILSGFLIIFVFSLGAYELPAILGATKPRALPVQAYLEYIHPDLHNRPYAMALNGVIIIISSISAGIYFILMEKNIKSLLPGKQVKNNG
jgi:putative spermidine/putrescine transport system permease protein